MITLPDDAPPGAVMVHADAVATRSFVAEARGREAIVDAHLDAVRTLTSGRPLWFPTFNYDFLRSGVYSVDHDPAQVGAINEAVRADARWRTSMPVFNFAGRDSAPQDTDVTLGHPHLPFDAKSPFGQLVEADGVVLWYGAPISTGTILHHAEHAAGGPAYRYDKDFAGRVERGGTSHDVLLRYHVRPQGRPLGYDWPRITDDGEREGVINRIDDSAVWWAPATALVGFWIEQLRADPLYLLDAESRAWTEPALDELGRRFTVSDFEEER